MSAKVIFTPNRMEPVLVTDIVVDHSWVHWAQWTRARGGEVLRLEMGGGNAETIFSGPEGPGLVVADEALYLTVGHQLVTIPTSGGAPRTLAAAPSELREVIVARQRVWLRELESARLSWLPKEGGPIEASVDEINALMMVSDGNALFAMTSDGVSGALCLVRLTDDGTRAATLRVGNVATKEQREWAARQTVMTPALQSFLSDSMIVTGMAVDHENAYWSMHGTGGLSQLWSAPRFFTSCSWALALRLGGPVRGAHSLAAFGDYLYFLDDDGPVRVRKSGGRIERLGPVATALAVGPTGVYAGTVDGRILLVDSMLTH